ncbi:hypothetical protein GEMRC1_011566 [Eukaryota sp. GEM-RC1]
MFLKLLFPVNGSCEEIASLAPFSFVVNVNISINFDCFVIPSGFSYTKICEFSDFEPAVGTAAIYFTLPLVLLELEFYGYPSGHCVSPINLNIGQTSAGDLLPISSVIIFDGQFFTAIDHLKQRLLMSDFTAQSYTRNLNGLKILTLNLRIETFDCFIPSIPFSHTFTESNPISINIQNSPVLFDPSQNFLNIEVVCFDPVGFPVSCGSEHFVADSSLTSSSSSLSNTTLVLTLDDFPVLGLNTMSFAIFNSIFDFSFNVFQTTDQIFEFSISNIQTCEDPHSFEYSCLLFSFNAYFISLLSTENVTQPLFSEDLKLTTDNCILSSLNQTHVQIFGFPETSCIVDVMYDSYDLQFSIDILSCPSSRAQSDAGCFCHPGFEFNEDGTCVECPQNFISAADFNSQCRQCPYPRVTLSTGSSSFNHCVCPLQFLDLNNECIFCPRLITCFYGDIQRLETGYLYQSNDVYECYYWYNCRNNSCMSYSFGSHCHLCPSSSVISDFVCLNLNFTNFWIGLCVLMGYVVGSLISDYLTLSFFIKKQTLQRFLFVFDGHSSDWSDVKNRFSESFLLSIRFGTLLLLVIPVVFTGRISDLKTVFEYVRVVFFFDPTRVTPVVMLFLMGKFNFWFLFTFFKKFDTVKKEFYWYNSFFLVVASLFSVNFVYSFVYRLVFFSEISVASVILLVLHSPIIVFVIWKQQGQPNYPVYIIVIVLMFSDFLPLFVYLAFQVFGLVFIANRVVKLDRFIVTALTMMSLLYLFELILSIGWIFSLVG